MKRKLKPGVPRLFDRRKYRQRYVIERMFGWLKENRRIVTRFDNLAKNYGLAGLFHTVFATSLFVQHLAEFNKALQMLKDFRCGKCKRLLARMGEHTELQIKCSRCGTLNHAKASSLERSPLSDMNADCSASLHSNQ